LVLSIEHQTKRNTGNQDKEHDAHLTFFTK